MENKPLTEPQLQALLRLKRHEQPPPGYFDDLLSSIHRRQREEMLRRPAWRIFAGRLRAFFNSLDWKYAGAMAGVLVVGIAVIQFALPGRPPASAIAVGTNEDFAQPLGLPSSMPGAIVQEVEREPLVTLQFQAGGPIFQIQRGSRFNPGPMVGAGTTGVTRFAIESQPASYEPPQQIRF